MRCIIVSKERTIIWILGRDIRFRWFTVGSTTESPVVFPSVKDAQDHLDKDLDSRYHSKTIGIMSLDEFNILKIMGS